MARRYLPIGHRLRQRVVSDDIMYPAREEAGPPQLKDTAFVHVAARRAATEGYEHYLGQP